MLIMREAVHERGQGYTGNLTALKPVTALKTKAYQNTLRIK